MRLLIALVALLFLLPSALAGSSEYPEVTDVAGDAWPPPANGYADLLDAWFVQVGDDVEVHLRVAALDPPPVTTAYFVVWESAGRMRFAAFAFRDDVDGPVFARGEWDAESGFAGDTHMTEGTLERGVPSHAVVRVPAGDFGPLGRAEKVHALVVDYKPNLVGAAPVVLDVADAGRDFALAGATGAVAEEPPASVGQKTVPLPAMVALAACLFGARLRRSGRRGACAAYG